MSINIIKIALARTNKKDPSLQRYYDKMELLCHNIEISIEEMKNLIDKQLSYMLLVDKNLNLEYTTKILNEDYKQVKNMESILNQMRDSNEITK
jgi:hypothetical protein